MSFILSNVHTHTDFCDGTDSMEEMVKTAVEKGFDTLGFSFHSYVHFDKENCIRNYPAYIEEFSRVRALYKDKINLLNGVELDFYGERPEHSDYVIGSVHYFKKDGEFYPVDYSLKRFASVVKDVFAGEVIKSVELYYEELADMINTLKPDIVGHFDLITRFNKNSRFFDENSDEYKKVLNRTMYKIPDGITAEINLGRLFKREGDIYPSEYIIGLLKEKSCRFMLSSDAHRKEALGFKFGETAERLKNLGIKSLCAYSGSKIEDFDI